MKTIIKRARSLWEWVNNNLLFICSFFLLAFIPLFPKLPLLDALPGYIVRIRVEDFLVFFTAVIWLREVRAGRILWNTSYFWFVVAYAVVGAISIFLGIFLLKTIPFGLLHFGKSTLHLLRYLEYFSLFFFFFSSIVTKKQIYAVLVMMVFVLLGVVGYGLGQKYLHFPVYSTMNREYSKGEKLYLEQGARPQSTFAGHYDLAVYLVIILPIIFSLAIGVVHKPFQTKRFMIAAGLGLAFTLGTGMLILTGSKASIAAFAVGLLIVIALYVIRIRSTKSRIKIAVLLLITALLGATLSWYLAPLSIKNKVTAVWQKLKPSMHGQPKDLVGDSYENKEIYTPQPDGTVHVSQVRVRKTWSDNALKYGLSMGIRLDTLWPQALLGFVRSPLTGSGYGTLAMLDSNLFQEADSTDNNFLRTLGETGILGFITFYGMALFVLRKTYLFARKSSSLSSQLSIGFCASIGGLLISAVYLDVFAASKVAFVFWAIAGLVLKAQELTDPELLSSKKLLRPIRRVLGHILKTWPLLLAIILVFIFLHQNPFMAHNPTKDIEGFTQGLEEITSARCFIKSGIFSICRNSGLQLSPHFTLYAALLVPFFRLFQIVGTFYIPNLLLILISLTLSYFFFRRTYKSTKLFLGLIAAVAVAVSLKLTGLPLTGNRLLLVAIGLPVLIAGICFLITYLRDSLAQVVRRTVIIIVFLIFTQSIFSGDLIFRFRNIAPNLAFTAVQFANGQIPTSSKQAYLATLLNPYFVDEYTLGKYVVFPLSEKQPYSNTPDRVWGFSKTANLHNIYSSVLSSGGRLFVSDFGINTNPNYAKSFTSLKQTFDLSYLGLGCEELCNIYSVAPAKTQVSNDIVSMLNDKNLPIEDLPSTYSFAVVSNRFDPKLGELQDSRYFQKQLLRIKKQLSFMVISGDVSVSPEGEFTQVFINEFPNKVSYPVLFTPGNTDIIPIKNIKRGYQEFFTNSEYFILMDADIKSQISMVQQLALYNSFLKLEKLPRIKSLFIIAHDLNWQDSSNPKNAIHILERKLKDFPYIHTYIFTANHSTSLSTLDDWNSIVNDEKSNVTFIASLTAGNDRDKFVELTISEFGEVVLNVKTLKGD